MPPRANRQKDRKFTPSHFWKRTNLKYIREEYCFERNDQSILSPPTGENLFSCKCRPRAPQS